MNKALIAFCGDVCSKCPRYIATLSNDPNELSAVAKLWYRAGFRDRLVSTDEIQCSGCSKAKTCGYELNTCTNLAEKDNCGECDLFPCEKFENVFKRSKHFEAICREKCRPEEFAQLKKAFFLKKDILMEIHRKKVLEKKH